MLALVTVCTVQPLEEHASAHVPSQLTASCTFVDETRATRVPSGTVLCSFTEMRTPCGMNCGSKLTLGASGGGGGGLEGGTGEGGGRVGGGGLGNDAA